MLERCSESHGRELGVPSVNADSGGVTTPHSAAPAALGFLAQVEYALLLALQRLDTTLTFEMSLETLDDIVFDDGIEDRSELFQTKHHVDRSAHLTDASTDVWKTLRNWIEDSPATANLTMLTTAAAPEGSAMSYLRGGAGRDVARATKLLVSTARNSENQALKSAFGTFLEVERPEELLERVTLIDESPQVADLDEALSLAVRKSAKLGHRAPLLQRLRGWWLEKVYDHLTRIAAGEPDRILSDELEATLLNISRNLRDDDLPIDFYDMAEPTDDEVRDDDRVFVHQLRVIALANARIRECIYDHNRAFAQRSRWQREKLIGAGELRNYERALVEEWKRHFLPETDEVDGDDDDDAVHCERARKQLIRLGSSTLPRIRPGVDAAYVASGSLHILADNLEIGWHPNWVARMRELLGDATGAHEEGVA